MLKRLAPLTLVLALAAPATASAEVTIKVGKGKFTQEKYRETFYPEGFRLKGKTGAYRGPVTVEVDEFPYDGAFADGGTVDTNDKGEYVFPKVGPSRNAQVRVRAGSERSKTLTLYTHPGLKAKTRVRGDILEFTITFTGHPGFAPPDPNALFVYMAKTKERIARRLGSARTLRQISDGRWRHTGTARLPSSRKGYRFFSLFCAKGLGAAGYGRPWPLDVQCGKKTIKP